MFIYDKDIPLDDVVSTGSLVEAIKQVVLPSEFPFIYGKEIFDRTTDIN